MVTPTPQWGSFQKPSIQQKNQEPEKNTDEITEGGIQDELDSENSIEKPQWGNFLTPATYQGEPDPETDENTLGYLARNLVANTSRLGEQIAGRWGNIEKVGKDLLTSVPILGGPLGWAISELVGPEKWEQIVKGPAKQQMLPTSEDLKKVSQDLTGGYTKPKTPEEEKFQGYVEDIGASINRAAPNLGRTVGRNAAINNFAIPIASNVVKDVVEDLGFGKDKATYAKLGTWTMLSLLGNVNAPYYASQLMNQGRQGMPPSAVANIPRLENRLNQVESTLLNADPRNALARTQLNALRQDIARGQTSTRSLMQSYDGLNAAKRSKDLFGLPTGDKRFARNAINRVRDVLRDEIMDSGAAHPQALQDWRSGVEAWATIHQSRAITNWIEDTAQGPYSKILAGPAATLFGIGGYGAYKVPVIGLSGTAAAPAAYKSIQTAYRMWNSPDLANYYSQALMAAQQQNLPAFLNNYTKLNKKLEKDESVNGDKKAKPAKK